MIMIKIKRGGEVRGGCLSSGEFGVQSAEFKETDPGLDACGRVCSLIAAYWTFYIFLINRR